ncbi:hypothetical protein KC340_g81 [Hortaea werneckii]|nr:hypothetical protein KC340_g81 [Hortaea werneckii]
MLDQSGRHLHFIRVRVGCIKPVFSTILGLPMMHPEETLTHADDIGQRIDRLSVLQIGIKRDKTAVDGRVYLEAAPGVRTATHPERTAPRLDSRSKDHSSARAGVAADASSQRRAGLSRLQERCETFHGPYRPLLRSIRGTDDDARGPSFDEGLRSQVQRSADVSSDPMDWLPSSDIERRIRFSSVTSASTSFVSLNRSDFSVFVRSSLCTTSRRLTSAKRSDFERPPMRTILETPSSNNWPEIASLFVRKWALDRGQRPRNSTATLSISRPGINRRDSLSVVTAERSNSKPGLVA